MRVPGRSSTFLRSLAQTPLLQIPNSLEMSTSLSALPDELLLRIVQNVPEVRHLRATDKRFCQICADVSVQRGDPLPIACRAIRCVMVWTKPGNLTDKLCTRICTEVIQAIGDENFHAANSALNVIQKLPSNTRIPDDHFFDLLTAVRDFIVQAISDGDFHAANSALNVIQELPSNTRIPDGFFPSLQAY